MSMDVEKLIEQGKQAFESKKYDLAIDTFSQVVAAYESQGDELNAAEMKNNLSVALLQAGKAQQAYDVVVGTDEAFAVHGDVKRQAMALGNQATALEAMGDLDKALTAYERSAELFARVDESEMRSVVLQSAAAINLRRGKIIDSAISMIGSVESTKKPNLLQRFLRFILRFKL